MSFGGGSWAVASRRRMAIGGGEMGGCYGGGEMGGMHYGGGEMGGVRLRRDVVVRPDAVVQLAGDVQPGGGRVPRV